jgi:IS5 family transposase
MGRPLQDRYSIARAFVAKSVYNHPTTRALIEALHTMPNLRMICGFAKKSDIPSEATFSRAFSEFAKSELGDRVHKVLVEEHISEELIGHISKDSTAIKGNERPVKKETKEGKEKQGDEKKKRGRPKKGEIREGKKEERRLDKQINQSPEEALKEIPTVCDVGTKTNAKGYKESWVGYKFHLDTADCGLPIVGVLTSASLHDSQVAIPMMKITTNRINYLYDLMDSAYDAREIYEMSRALGHVPIIERNARRGDAMPMSAAEAIRYNERTVAERSNSRLKGDFGGETVMVRGYKKVKLHLMFGIIALFADQLLKLIM